MNWIAEFVAIGTAISAGLLIGIERGWNLRMVEDGRRVAGVRTFTLMGLLSGLAGLIGRDGQWLVAGALVGSAAMLLLIGYARRSAEDKKPDATTSVAGLATLTLGYVAGGGRPGLAIAGATLAAFVLALRKESHRFLRRLDEEDVKALVRFAVIAGAVLPFLPNGNYGPFDAWNPQKLWLVVVLVTGFSFAGYVANRIFGTRHGTIVTALIGGAYSSTAVTQSLSQRLGAGDEGGPAECAGIAVASAVMYLRVLVLVAALATSVFMSIAMLIAPPLIVGSLAGWWLYRRAGKSKGSAPPGNPIAMVPALAFLLFVAIAAVAARWAEGRFGQQGLATLILIMGSLDVDAAIVTVGGLGPGVMAPPLAALALAGTVLINMTVKLGIVLVYGRSKGKAGALALGASMIALAGSLAVGVARL